MKADSLIIFYIFGLILSYCTQTVFAEDPKIHANQDKKTGFYEKNSSTDFDKQDNQIHDSENHDPAKTADKNLNQDFQENEPFNSNEFDALPEDVKLSLKNPFYLSSIIDCSDSNKSINSFKNQISLAQKSNIPYYLTFCIGLLNSNKPYYEKLYKKINEVQNKEDLRKFLSRPNEFLAEEIKSIKDAQVSPPSMIPELTAEQQSLSEQEQAEIQISYTKNAVNLFKRLMPVNEIPEKYKNTKKIPTWIIGTENGEILFEAVSVDALVKILNKAKLFKATIKEGETGLSEEKPELFGDKKTVSKEKEIAKNNKRKQKDKNKGAKITPSPAPTVSPLPQAVPKSTESSENGLDSF